MPSNSLSTGPRTQRGKQISALNSVRHGVFAKVPVVDGLEREEDWEKHRQGVLASVAPATHLEYALAERLALLIWRLHRLSRYEGERLRRQQDGVEAEVSDRARIRTGRLPPSRAIRQERLELDQMALDVVIGLGRLEPGTPVDREDAELVLELLVVPPDAVPIGGPESDPLPPALREAFDAVATWTYGDLMRLVALVAAAQGTAPDAFASDQLAILIQRVEDARHDLTTYDRAVRYLRTSHMLLVDSELDRIARYEAHLSRQLNSTLHELEALQARRQGQPTPLARLDVSAPA